jgi:hypothetical protein
MTSQDSTFSRLWSNTKSSSFGGQREWIAFKAAICAAASRETGWGKRRKEGAQGGATGRQADLAVLS